MQIKSWLNQCLQSGHSCNADPPWMLALQHKVPSRLIDVGLPDGTVQPRLCLRSDLDRSSRYIALSHCWGRDPSRNVPQLTQVNLKLRQREILLDSLSKTFRDAIQITRALSVRYIWIDSLCIIQDSQEDFEKECAGMHFVYSQAFCTIAALGAEDGSEGCFMPRNLLRLNPYTFKLSSLEGHWLSIQSHFERMPHDRLPYLLRGPLNTRGWALQERQFSRRIIYYTKDQIIWECAESFAFEENPSMYRKFLCSDENWRLFDLHVKGRTDLHDRWYNIIQDYSGRHLSHSADRFLALSGLAAAFNSARPTDSYLAGLWEDDILRGLWWSPSPVRSPPQDAWPPPAKYPHTPSWSWAAFDGPVRFGRTVRLNLKETCFVHGEVNVPGFNSYGTVYGGSITLCGLRVEIPVSEQYVCRQDHEDLPKLYKVPPNLNKLYDESLTIRFDHSPKDLPLTYVVCLQIGQLDKGIVKSGVGRGLICGLVLLRCNGYNVGKCQRTGTFSAPSSASVWVENSIMEQVIII